MSTHSVLRSIIFGIGIGLVIPLFLITFNTGLGASKSIALAAFHIQNWFAPVTEEMPYIHYYLTGGDGDITSKFYASSVAMIGVIIGSFLTAHFRHDAQLSVTRGPKIGIPHRFALAALGGTIIGFSTRLAWGCTSGVGLVGGMQMSVGAYAFLFSAFAGGFAFAYFLRRQWL